MKPEDKIREKKFAKKAQKIFDKNNKDKKKSRRLDSNEAMKSLHEKKNLREIKPFKDASFKAEKYGGKAGDFKKVSSPKFGNVEAHGVKKKTTGKIFEPKIVHKDVRSNRDTMIKKIEKKKY